MAPHNFSLPSQSARMLAAILDNVHDAIIHKTLDGIVIGWSAGAERLYGYTAGEIIGSSIGALIPEEQRSGLPGMLERLRSGGTVARHETVRRSKDGRPVRVMLTVFPVTMDGGEPVSAVSIASEVTPIERAELAHLGEMAAVLAHEIRNALAGVRGAVRLIGERLQPGSAEASAVPGVVARLDALSTVVNDIVLFAHLPRPRADDLDLGRLIADTVDSVRSSPEFTDLRVEVAVSIPLVRCDAALLKVVLGNLLTNSAQAMGGRGTIRVSADPAGSSCRIVVADEGPGIPPELRGRLFTPFFTTKTRGTGLGLATARRIAEAHGGRLHAEWPPDGGMRVTLELPGVSRS